MILLSQAQSDRAILAKQIGISEHQLSSITQSNSGEGLLFYGSVTIPFVDRFPRGEIYDSWCSEIPICLARMVRSLCACDSRIIKSVLSRMFSISR